MSSHVNILASLRASSDEHLVEAQHASAARVRAVHDGPELPESMMSEKRKDAVWLRCCFSCSVVVICWFWFLCF